MELAAALEGNLQDIYKAELLAGERACMAAMGIAIAYGKQRLRDQTTGAGLGPRVANAWRSKVYPSSGQSLDAAGLVFSKASKIIRAFNDGVTIRSSKGKFLAIPTDAAPKSVGGKRATPALVEQALGIKLRFVPRRGGRPALLVADNARLTSKGRGRRASPTAIGKGRVATVVMFVLLPQVRLPKRLNVERVGEEAADVLETQIVRQWDTLAA